MKEKLIRKLCKMDLKKDKKRLKKEEQDSSSDEEEQLLESKQETQEGKTHQNVKEPTSNKTTSESGKERVAVEEQSEKERLKEKEQQEHIDALRDQEQLTLMKEWLKESRVVCRTDDTFLLRFLRHRKFRQKEAREGLLAYITMRLERPKWFSRLDLSDPTLTTLVDGGFFFPLLERDALGRRVVFSRVAAVDPSHHTTTHQMRAILVCFETLLEDPVNQERGISYVMDERGVGWQFLTVWGLGDVTGALQCCEKTLPLRHKAVHLLHLPLIFTAILEFIKTLLSRKMAGRLQVHSSLPSLHTAVSSHILPQEYGGTVPMADMIRQYRTEALQVRSSVLALDDMLVAKPL